MKDRFWERGGLWVGCQAVLMLAVFILGLTYRAEHRQLAVILLGVSNFAFGAFIGIAGALALGPNLTPFPKPLPQAQLVRHGIYARIRHPLYTSVVFASIGWALFWLSWPALWIALALVPFFDVKARHEERWLRERFPEYTNYAKDTRRFLPWIY